MKVRKISLLKDFQFEKRDQLFGVVKYTQLTPFLTLSKWKDYFVVDFFCSIYFLGALCNLFGGALFAGYAGL